MGKELFIMRHAKSAWDSDASDDISRPLKKRGVNAAKRIGDGLSRLGWIPEKILVSPAERAKQTCELISLDAPVEEDMRIYNASLTDLFEVIAEVPDSTERLMIIGHNPGLEELLLHLAPAAERQKNGKLLTTANVARIGIQGKWANLSDQKGQLMGHIRPKEMDDE
jgi:phosphohistidine phosphatase